MSPTPVISSCFCGANPNKVITPYGEAPYWVRCSTGNDCPMAFVGSQAPQVWELLMATIAAKVRVERTLARLEVAGEVIKIRDEATDSLTDALRKCEKEATRAGDDSGNPDFETIELIARDSLAAHFAAKKDQA